MCAHSNESNAVPSSTRHFSIRSLTYALFTLAFTSLNTYGGADAAKPNTKPSSPNALFDLKGVRNPAVLPHGDKNEPPNLRKVLYPTYFSHEPYEMDTWKFYNGNELPPVRFAWSPMSHYAEIFDRNLRSGVDYVVIEQTAEPATTSTENLKFESQETPEFIFGRPGFLPFYSGRGRRR